MVSVFDKIGAGGVLDQGVDGKCCTLSEANKLPRCKQAGYC